MKQRGRPKGSGVLKRPAGAQADTEEAVDVEEYPDDETPEQSTGLDPEDGEMVPTGEAPEIKEAVEIDNVLPAQAERPKVEKPLSASAKRQAATARASIAAPVAQPRAGYGTNSGGLRQAWQHMDQLSMADLE